MSEIPERNPPRDLGRPFRWQAIDHSIARLKLTDLAIEMQRKVRAEERRIHFENRLNMNGNTEPWLILQMKEENADESAARTYDIYCTAWKAQGQAKTAAFVRAVYTHAVRVGLRARATKHQFLMWARRTDFNIPLVRAHLQSFELRTQRLQSKWFRRLEIEAKELEHAERIYRLKSASIPLPHVAPSAHSSAAVDADRVRPADTRLEAIIWKVQHPEQNRFLTTEETALYYRVRARTIHRWIEGEKLKHGGRRGMVTIASIRRWDAKRSHRPRTDYS